MGLAPRPTAWQTRRTKAVVRWYLSRHHGQSSTPGLPGMYCDPAVVGPFAVELDALQAGEPEALFTALFVTTMHQRLRDVLVHRILRSVPPAVAAELTSPARLRAEALACGCPHAHSLAGLLKRCDLAKHPATKEGTCTASPDEPCPLKRHTEVLRRYGHFGKFPTSIAHLLAENDVTSLPELYQCATRERPPAAAATWLRAELSRAWRVSDKIACMFLSLVSNPDILPGAPWQDGLDWTQFVVVDSNVDLFLAELGYHGLGTYRARSAFVCALARRVRLDELAPGLGLQRYNPRLVQQALYLFMSSSNRSELEGDCHHLRPSACGDCPAVLRAPCPLRARKASTGPRAGRGS